MQHKQNDLKMKKKLVKMNHTSQSNKGKSACFKLDCNWFPLTFQKCIQKGKQCLWRKLNHNHFIHLLFQFFLKACV